MQENLALKKRLKNFETIPCHTIQVNSYLKYHFCRGSANLCPKKDQDVWGGLEKNHGQSKSNTYWYTSDSDCCLAAKHMGVLDEKGGLCIVVEGLGQKKYDGSASNGVVSKDYGSYKSSISFKALE